MSTEKARVGVGIWWYSDVAIFSVVKVLLLSSMLSSKLPLLFSFATKVT